MSGSLDARLQALGEAVELADGRLDPAAVQAARAVVTRAGARLGLGMETTVVALAGPTGAGKSSLFNALAGAELTAAGVRRPTTATVTAAIRGDVDPALLDWLAVQTRHAFGGGTDPGPEDRTDGASNRTPEGKGTDPGPEGKGSDPGPGNRTDGASNRSGLVLLDLPDYDSVEVSHRREVDRVIELVDLMVWVVDPQKYADAALHDGYLRRLAGHAEVMVLVLNQADRLDAEAVAACRADLQRLLKEDGLPGLPVLALSATTGQGLQDLEKLLRDRARKRAAAVARLGADVAAAAERLAPACAGHARKGGVAKADRARLVAALADAAGVPVVVQAVGAAHRRRGALAAGWPPARWLRRLRRDPLKRLRLGDPPHGELEVHTSLPRATPVQQAQVASAARTLANTAADDLADPWPSRLRTVATAHEADLAERLDRAVAGTDLRVRRPRWWTIAGLLQRALALAALAGALWLVALAALAYLQLDDVIALPELQGIPLPTLLLGGGLLGGLLLAALARWINGSGARRRARVAERALRAPVEEVADELVVAPVKAELADRERLCAAISRSRR